MIIRLFCVIYDLLDTLWRCAWGVCLLCCFFVIILFICCVVECFCRLWLRCCFGCLFMNVWLGVMLIDVVLVLMLFVWLDV